MTFTKEQLKILSAWEENFQTAVKAKWARNPGRTALRVIYDIFTQATGDRRRFSDNCSNCILNLLSDCGKLYFEDTLRAAVDNLPTKDVKVSQEAKETVRKAKIKTIKKSK